MIPTTITTTMQRFLLHSGVSIAFFRRARPSHRHLSKGFHSTSATPSSSSSSTSSGVKLEHTIGDKAARTFVESEKVLKAACGDVNENNNNDDDDDDEDEMEEMFVDPHASFQHRQREWGGPTRGGRFAEPTRFGDWERKGRCTDF